MPEKINWTLNVQVIGGPKISASQTMSVDAYDKIEVVIPGGDSATPGTATVEVQPGDLDQVEFLLISSDQYGENLTYTVTGGASGVKLDKQQLLVGEGAVGLLVAAPQTLEFSNGLGVDQDATVTILVGRNAIPPTP